MDVIAWPGPGDSGHDVEPWHAGGLRDVRLVLPEKAPQHGPEPDLKPPSYSRVRVVLVVPELVRELLVLHREGDRDDHLGQARAVLVTGNAAWVAEPVPGLGRPPADAAHPAARRKDRYEMVEVGVAELEDRGHRGVMPRRDPSTPTPAAAGQRTRRWQSPPR